MNKLRVLHIVPWFPNPNNCIEGIFIAEHIKQLNMHCANHVLHINFGKTKEIKTDKYQNISIDRITIKPILEKWIFKEKQATIAIKNYLKKTHSNFDIVNFYITYPNAISITKLSKTYPDIKFCMMEQWSAYHTQFNLPKENKGRTRIENIFNNNIPLFTVSNALGQDIQNFIGNKKRAFEVIPNCVNENDFYYKEKQESNTFIFTSINNWSVMKNPIVLIKAFHLLTTKYSNLKLILAGDGILIPKMKKLVAELEIEKHVEFKGRISKKEVVTELQNANIYCQSSNYETFSAICIESLATGTPVIATDIGGMKDFINNDNGERVQNLEVESWFLAMERNFLNYKKFDTNAISKNAINTFNSDIVGEIYFDKLKAIYNGK